MAALQGTLPHGGKIAQGPHPAAEPLRQGLRQEPVGPGGALVEDNAPDAAVWLEVQEPLEHRQGGEAHPPGADHQHHRAGGAPRRLIGAGTVPGGACAVVIAHDPLDDRHVPVSAVPCQQVPGSVRVEEKGVQVGAPAAGDLAVEHGVDVVRPALAGPHPEPPVHQGPEHGAGDGGLAAAAVGPGQQEPRHTFLHIQSPPWLKEKEKARQRSAAAAVFPRRMPPLPHPGKRGARLQAGLLAYGSGRISPASAAPRLPGLPVTGFRQRTPAHPAYSGGTARDSHPVLYSPRRAGRPAGHLEVLFPCIV